jgi:hypothetical protein
VPICCWISFDLLSSVSRFSGIIRDGSGSKDGGRNLKAVNANG